MKLTALLQLAGLLHLGLTLAGATMPRVVGLRAHVATLPEFVRRLFWVYYGFIGLCLTTSEISRDNVRHLRFDDPLKAAARYLPLLKRRGANVIVAVTHLSFAEDRALVRRFPEIDLVIGGHEHFPIAVTEGRTLISKAGSDARRVARIDVDRLAHRTVERFYELLPITSDIPDEPRTAAVIKSYEDRLSTELDTVVATSRVPLDADTVRLRVSVNGLKTIEHNGGIDSFLLSTTDSKLSAEARRLKKSIQRALASKQSVAA